MTSAIKQYLKTEDKGVRSDLLYDLTLKDQLNNCKGQNPYLMLYEEAPLSFLPTYKYDKGSHEYDTSKKQRTPSWCDRIMIGTRQGSIIEQFAYKRLERTDSDHRPVTAMYRLSMRTIDKQKMLETKQQFHTQNE